MPMNKMVTVLDVVGEGDEGERLVWHKFQTRFLICVVGLLFLKGGRHED